MSNSHEPTPGGVPPLADPRSPEVNDQLAAAAAIDVTDLDRNDAALVLLIRQEFRVRPVHPRHQGVIIGIGSQHGVAGNHFAGFLVGPVIPQARQSPWHSIGATKAPPHIAPGLPAWLVEGPSRDDAAPAI